MSLRGRLSAHEPRLPSPWCEIRSPPRHAGKLYRVSGSQLEKHLVDLCIPRIGKRPGEAAHFKTTLLQNTNGSDIIAGDAGVERAVIHNTEKLPQRLCSDSTSPEFLPNPICDLGFTVPQEASHTAGDVALPEDDLLDYGGVREDSGPMLEERVTVGGSARNEGSHPARFRIFLVLEENWQVIFDDISQDDGVAQA
jgi:hypothetical protein